MSSRFCPRFCPVLSRHIDHDEPSRLFSCNKQVQCLIDLQQFELVSKEIINVDLLGAQPLKTLMDIQPRVGPSSGHLPAVHHDDH